MGLQLKRKEMYGKNTVDGLHEDKCWKQRHDMDKRYGSIPQDQHPL